MARPLPAPWRRLREPWVTPEEQPRHRPVTALSSFQEKAKEIHQEKTEMLNLAHFYVISLFSSLARFLLSFFFLFQTVEQ